MDTRSIEVEDFSIPANMGSPFRYEGKHSGGELAGIHLDLRVGGPDLNETVDELLGRDSVWVQDPFAERRYEAVPSIQTVRYGDDSWTRHYTAELREVDRPPEFDILDINGNRFPVAKYFEDTYEDKDYPGEAIGRHALLRLTPEQFEQLQDLFDEEQVQIQRLGIDEEPHNVRFGGAMYWSRHDEDGEVFYKQVVRFFPVDFPYSKGPHIASDIDLQAVKSVVHTLSVRFEALLDDLTARGVLDIDRRDHLLGEDWQSLVDDARRSKAYREFRRVRNAEDELE